MLAVSSEAATANEVDSNENGAATATASGNTDGDNSHGINEVSFF